jgi:hypothetical protein
MLVNPSLAVASEGFFDSEDFSKLTLGFELRTAIMAFLVWKEMDADLPETREASWLTEPIGPPPDPSPSGAPHQLPDLLHTPTSAGG